jgi:hypothetical protein
MSVLRRRRTASAIIAAAIAGTLVARAWTAATTPSILDRAANEYLRLAWALGERDPSALDQVIVRPAPSPNRLPLEDIDRDATSLVDQLNQTTATNPIADERRRHLVAQLGAIATRAQYLDGHRIAVEDEVRRLFRVDLPAEKVVPPASAFHTLDEMLPGAGSLADRLERFESQFIVPADRVAIVFERAIAECRARTIESLALPRDESVDVAFVQDRPWSGYSSYLGGNRSRIEVNISFPLTVDRMLELACHEGYPGHHVQSTLRDSTLVRARGWKEFSVLPIFSPDSFEAEAAASMAASMAFTEEERVAFEQDVLFPLARLDASRTSEYLKIARVRDEACGALASITAHYLAGYLDFVEAAWALQRDAMMAHPIATLQFINEYRGFALAYTLGRIRMTPLLGPTVPAAKRWANLRSIIEGDGARGVDVHPRSVGFGRAFDWPVFSELRNSVGVSTRMP